MQFYLHSCEQKNAIGCANAGLLHKEGLGVKKDQNKANELFKKACEYGDIESC